MSEYFVDKVLWAHNETAKKIAREKAHNAAPLNNRDAPIDLSSFIQLSLKIIIFPETVSTVKIGNIPEFIIPGERNSRLIVLGGNIPVHIGP